MPTPLARWSFLLALPSVSCVVVVDGHRSGHSIRGSGIPAEEQRSIAEFRAVELEVPATAVVRVGSGPTLHLSGDDNLLPLVRTTVSGGVLTIDLGQSASFRRGLEIVIETPSLEGFTIEGSGDVRIEGLANERVELGIDGSGTIHASGRTHDLVGTIEGSGSLELAELESAHAQLSIEGSGAMDVRVAERLRYSIEGSGDIRYAGEPEVDGSIEGSGDVEKRR